MWIFHTIVDLSRRVWLDLEPRLYLIGQGQSSHITKILVWTITSNVKLDLNDILHNYTQLISMSQGCVMTWAIGHFPRSRSKCTHTWNPCPGQNCLLEGWILIIFHTIVVYDRRVCHDLDPRSYIQGQGHIAHIAIILVRVKTHYYHVGLGKCFMQLLSMTQGCVMTLTHCHISKVKVTMHT